jgi:CBS domain-containing protein/anti-sigma regulatory factor (Ser/Thr protein kinase)
VLDLIYALKVKDVMTPQPVRADEGTTIREIRTLLKERGITGIPITEGNELRGMVSMEDVLNAMDRGAVEEPARLHMSTQLIVLEDDMPVFFAISYFDKYPYHRFPVLDSSHRLVGIVTTRDITTRLLLEANRELERIEQQERLRQSPQEQPSGPLQKRFTITRHDFENAGYASTEIKKLLKARAGPPQIARRISIAAYELEMNLVIHSDGGILRFILDEEKAVIEASDNGPGMENPSQALEPGYTTASEWIRSLGFGAGLGLPNVRKVSDAFDLRSSPGSGTRAVATLHLTQREEI